MKFSGLPGDPPRAYMASGEAVHPITLPAPPPWWGNGGPGPTQLALALAKAVLPDDEAMAIKIHQRLKWRTVAAWPSAQPWAITEDEIKTHIEDILKVERETAQTRTMVGLEPAPVVMEGGLGVGGRIEWDSAADAQPVQKISPAPPKSIATGEFTCSCGSKYHTVGGLQECVATNHGDAPLKGQAK